MGYQRYAGQREQPGDDKALVERAHDRLARAESDEERADDGRDDADAADGKGISHHSEQRVGAGGAKKDRRQHHGSDRRHGVGLEQVGRHPGAIADIVADIVGDGRGIARIILGNAGLDLADEVAAHVRPLGEDAAAETREDRDQRRAEAECHERVDDGAVVGRHMARADEKTEIERDAEERQASDQQPSDGAGFERQLEPIGERTDRRLGGAHVGAYGHVHADEAGCPREYRADQESNRHRGAEEIRKDEEDHDSDHADRGVLALEISLRAFAHGRGDLLHPRAAWISREYGADRPDGVEDSEHATKDDQPKSGHC